ncbi:MAG: LysE family translocator [Acidimicrobiales bacterium]
MDLAAVTSLAFVASITPGPNNLMLWASGLNHGIRGTVAHLLGVSAGFNLLLFTVAAGLGRLFERYPGFELSLKIVGGIYLLHLAFRIFNTSSIGEVEASNRPLSFLEAVAFQVVNPKAWVMAITAASIGLAPGIPVVAAALALTAVFAVVNFPCIVVWMVSGSFASRLLDRPNRLRAANRILGLLLAATVVLIVS